MTFGVPITYLLTEEKQKNGETENAKQFLQGNQQFMANNRHCSQHQYNIKSHHLRREKDHLLTGQTR